jgi:hypothetical protein
MITVLLVEEIKFVCVQQSSNYFNLKFTVVNQGAVFDKNFTSFSFHNKLSKTPIPLNL